MNVFGNWIVSIYAVTIALAGAFLICFMVVAIAGAACVVAVDAYYSHIKK